MRLIPSLEDQLRSIWDDQKAFNLLFRPDPTDDPAEMANQARDFVLFTESEMHELLRTLPWKKHRRMPFSGNNAHMLEEGTDVFKCALSLLQIIGIRDWNHLVELYWQKTAVVRQRYREEWQLKLDGECVIVDIDNVICDYVTGMCDWLCKDNPNLWGEEIGPSAVLRARIQALKTSRGYINASALSITEELWQMLKHQFRTSGQKRYLPVFRDAKPFLERCAAAKLRIVLLTSRPIDAYPNLFTDTILWLNDNELPFDFVWWAADKGERILQGGLKDKIKFAVDDDPRFVEQFARNNIPTHWLQRHGDLKTNLHGPLVTAVRSLSEIQIPNRG